MTMNLNLLPACDCSTLPGLCAPGDETQRLRAFSFPIKHTTNWTTFPAPGNFLKETEVAEWPLEIELAGGN